MVIVMVMGMTMAEGDGDDGGTIEDMRYVLGLVALTATRW